MARTLLLILLLLLLALLPAGSPAASASAGPPPAPPAQWPLADGPTVTRRFDPPPQPWLRGHRGVDLLAPLGAGSAVLAPISGTVVYASRIVDRGVLVIEQGPWRVSLEPVAASVPVGAVVVAGQQVGALEPVGGHCPPRACLHWGLRAAGAYVDPLLLLVRQRAVLLPADRRGH